MIPKLLNKAVSVGKMYPFDVEALLFRIFICLPALGRRNKILYITFDCFVIPLFLCVDDPHIPIAESESRHGTDHKADSSEQLKKRFLRSKNKDQPNHSQNCKRNDPVGLYRKIAGFIP